jgi:hypothetical protein
MLDGPPTPTWQQRVLEALEGSAAVEVVELRFVDGSPRTGVARAFERLERAVLQLGPGALVPGPPRSPAGRGGGAELLLWLAESPPLSEESRGLLRVRHGGREEPAERAVLRALREGAGTLESTLVLDAAGTTVVLARTVSGLRPYSPAATLDLLLWKLVGLVPRAVERLARAEPASSASAPQESAPSAPSATVAQAPVLARTALRWPSLLLKRLLYRRPWAIRLRRRAAEPTAGWMQAGEEIPAGGRLGVISHTELRLDGAPAEPPREVLAAPYHLSYPFVFAHRGEIFMIPETSAVERVQLYRAVEFPHRWELERVLLEGVDAADATLLEHDGRLWLFASVAQPGASSLDELHLFWAQELGGPWQAHPCNPVVSDARCARPAGAIQHWGGRLVRPGQDGSRRYGGAISFREIDRLDVGGYAEHEIARLGPEDVGDARATHTYNADRRFEAIDLRYLEPRLAWGRPRGAREAAARVAPR